MIQFVLTLLSFPEQPGHKMSQTNKGAPWLELPALPSTSHASGFAFEFDVLSGR